MTVQQVKKRMKDKFGQYSVFARLAGLDRYELQRDFLEAHRVDKSVIKAMAELVEKTGAPKDEISPEKIEELRKALVNAGGVVKFCRENTGFAEQSVFKILAGKRKRLTGKVKDLFDHFKIEI